LGIEALRRLGWTTDIHLNFVTLAGWDRFVMDVNDAQLDALLISGDVSEAEDVVWQMERLSAGVNVPIYFVLGNHDYYQGSIAKVRDEIAAACQRDSRLRYLSGSQPIALGNGWVLCGDDGWADARLGDYYRSPVRMNDFRLIAELRDLNAVTRYRKLRRLGTESAWRLGRQLAVARQLGRQILVVTHIPPFRESCWYEGRQSDDDWAPFFVCGAVGWVLKRFCKANPEHQVMVLCGHTHHSGMASIMCNLQVWTGAAEYGSPRLFARIDLVEPRFPESDWSFQSSGGTGP
jgi:3',5'-cyclic-AMP phosphodiesterase